MQELTGQSWGRALVRVGVALVRVGEDPVIAISFGKYKYNTYVVATSATGHVHTNNTVS